MLLEKGGNALLRFHESTRKVFFLKRLYGKLKWVTCAADGYRAWFPEELEYFG